MIRFDAVVAQFPDLGRSLIIDWIARGWVRVDGSDPDDWHFAEVDIARVRLIRELRIDLAVDEQALPVVLSLVDQVHGLRRSLERAIRALDGQPDSIRQLVLAALDRAPLD